MPSLAEACGLAANAATAASSSLTAVKRSMAVLASDLATRPAVIAQASLRDPRLTFAPGNDPRLAQALRAIDSAVRDPRWRLNRAAPSQVKGALQPGDARLRVAAPTDARLSLGIVESNDPRLRMAFEAIWTAYRGRWTWAELFRAQFPK